MENTDNIGVGAWNSNYNRNSHVGRDNSRNGSLIRTVAGLALLVGGVVASDRLTRTPIDYHGVPYLGYHVEKSEGSHVPVFGIKTQGWQPGSIALPRYQEDVPFRNDDEKFNCDDAFYKRGSHSSDGGLYDVHGYHGWLSGNVATNIVPAIRSETEK